jgi:transposase
MRKGIKVEVTAAAGVQLEAIAADRNSPQKHVWRARIILATADGCGTAAVMRRAGVSKPCVWRWQERFMHKGIDGLLRDQTRPSRIPPLPKAVIETVVTRTLQEPPLDGVTHWTAPAMAAASGLSVSSVQRIWRAHSACRG